MEMNFVMFFIAKSLFFLPTAVRLQQFFAF